MILPFLLAYNRFHVWRTGVQSRILVKFYFDETPFILGYDARGKFGWIGPNERISNIADYAKLYIDGYDLDQVARIKGVTRERVRQVLRVFVQRYGW